MEELDLNRVNLKIQFHEEEFSEMDESYLGLTFEGMPDLQDASFYGRGKIF